VEITVTRQNDIRGGLRGNYKQRGLLGCNSIYLSFPPVFVGFLLGLLFDPEEGDDIFLRNVSLSLKYTALRPRRPYSSQLPP
jgi:hypothetical protein